MKNFHIEVIQIEGREPYLKVYFEDVVDKDVIQTWLNMQGFIRKANVNEDEYCKVSAIVYLLPGSNVKDIEERLTSVLRKYNI